MNTMLISYDLKTPGKNYEDLLNHIQSYANWAKPLESFWLIKTNSSYEEVWDAAAKHIDSNDKLIVIDVTNDSAKWIVHDVKVSRWIKDNL